MMLASNCNHQNLQALLHKEDEHFQAFDSIKTHSGVKGDRFSPFSLYT
jgi:hypothetical protein